MFGLFRRRRPDTVRPEVPPGRRVYAIGDIHGRVDLLMELHARIARDAALAPGLSPIVVYLGDYIDRGLDSRAVIDLLLDRPLKGFESIHLLGNHESILLQFINDVTIGQSWLTNGGNFALFSYGVSVAPNEHDEQKLKAAQAAFVEALPERHLEFFRRLKLTHEEGDYLFVHAGIRPGVPLAQQKPHDLIWIRGDFLSSTATHDRIIVHGHSITTDVQVMPNRIGIDTGAYYSGRLTCLVLEGESRRFITT